MKLHCMARRRLPEAHPAWRRDAMRLMARRAFASDQPS